MKRVVLFLIVASALFSACQENLPPISCLTCPDGDPTDTLEPQDRRVLIEEFTGVECVGCPAGSAEIENLLFLNGERLVAVSIHTGPLSDPYPESQYDFRTEGGAFLLSYLGLPNGIPSAVINRKQFTGESDLQLVSSASWGGYVGQEAQGLAKTVLVLDNDYDPSSRTLNGKVIGQAFDNVDSEVRITIMLTESGIVDAQLTPETSPDTDPDYVHKHVLRKVLTAFDGDVIDGSLTIGDTFDKNFSFNIPNDWNADNCTVIAFTHLSGDKKEVLQVIEEDLRN